MVALAQPLSRSKSPGISSSRLRPRPRTGKYPYPRSTRTTSGRRFYSPGIGKWLSRDPIWEKGFRASANQDAMQFSPVEELGQRLIVLSHYGELSEDVSVAALATTLHNRYLFVLNDPVVFTDRLGLNITLETGSDSTEWFDRLNNIYHQQVCVDLWKDNATCTEETKWECCHRGKTCFSFAYIGRQWPQFSSTWLGWASAVVGAIMQGEIYERDQAIGATIDSTHMTTMQQDRNWLNYMADGTPHRVGTKDGYSVLRHNCRKYSQWEFRDAPLHW